MQKIEGPLRYKHELTFESKTKWQAFPFDMLRYDTCYPKMESDSHQMHASVADDSNLMPRRVTVVRYTHRAAPGWTMARWESFGWVPVYGRAKTEVEVVEAYLKGEMS